MSSEIAVRVSGLSKCFSTYDRPQNRLKQSLYSLAARLLPNGQLRQRLQQRAHACARHFWALHDIDFEVKKGETVGVIGRNGSGKSTLLQIICGTLAPTSGQVEVNGRVAALLELGSGFNPEYSGRENVYLNGQLLGLTREQVDQRFGDIAAFADIGDFIDQPVKAYSSGMYVRLAFAVIAHVDADVLVVDEALAVGDAFFTQKCMRFLRKFMKTGTVLFVSHDTGSLKNLCTHAIWIEKGRMLQTGSPKDVCDLYLQAFYEAQQGKSTTTQMRAAVKQSDKPAKDQRLTFLNATNLRNDIKLFAFDPDAASFGKGGAQITGVEFYDAAEHPLSWVVGGESVTLKISVVAHQLLESPIVGFYIKDKLGQTLFGDNTYLSYHDHAVVCHESDLLEAEFSFLMPILPRGEYTVNVAIAEGTQDEHTQLHWIHDALLFKSESSSASTGLVGIPMENIRLAAYADHADQGVK
ncbi:ABC transporter ATP-binding protein [Collimonas silvisoli]|uniref:ABC transporter ATP-binding protein n=1 Tax=Collimonas silvisoli TaxID=2825884 RepID=UPI001B8ADFEE|nr:ABC transporter ATP-binding protein [Collimonas silvisoli]